MKNKYLFLYILIAAVLGNLSSCGKANSSTLENVDCGYRYIAGHDCIVCSQGGVSCKW